MPLLLKFPSILLPHVGLTYTHCTGMVSNESWCIQCNLWELFQTQHLTHGRSRIVITSGGRSLFVKKLTELTLRAACIILHWMIDSWFHHVTTSRWPDKQFARVTDRCKWRSIGMNNQQDGRNLRWIITQTLTCYSSTVDLVHPVHPVWDMTHSSMEQHNASKLDPVPLDSGCRDKNGWLQRSQRVHTIPDTWADYWKGHHLQANTRNVLYDL